MNKIIRDNGILKTLLFISSNLLSLSMVSIYLYTTIGWPLFKSLNIFHLLLRCWIFFGVKSKDFFGDASKGHLKGKHVMMLSAFYLCSLFGNQDPYKILSSLAFLVLMSFFIDREHMRKGFYWEHNFHIDGYLEEDLRKAMKSFFFMLPSQKTSDGQVIKGYGYFCFKIKLECHGNMANIRIEPMNNGFVFLMAAKVLPANMGQYYGDKILKKLAEINLIK